jgi:hypothetical protein
MMQRKVVIVPQMNEGKQTAAIRQAIKELYEEVFGSGSFAVIGKNRFDNPNPEDGYGYDYPKDTGYEVLPEDVWYRFNFAKHRLRRWAGLETSDAEEVIAAVRAKLRAGTE